MGLGGDILPLKDTPIIPYFLDQRTSYIPGSSEKISSHFQTFHYLLDCKKEDSIEVLFTKSGPALEIAKSVGDCSTPLWEMQAKRIRSIFPFDNTTTLVYTCNV